VQTSSFLLLQFEHGCPTSQRTLRFAQGMQLTAFLPARMLKMSVTNSYRQSVVWTPGNTDELVITAQLSERLMPVLMV
jgi:hypothetical protein